MAKIPILRTRSEIMAPAVHNGIIEDPLYVVHIGTEIRAEATGSFEYMYGSWLKLYCGI